MWKAHVSDKDFDSFVTDSDNGIVATNLSAFHARLIAASPIMLNVLEELCQDIQSGGPEIEAEWPDLHVTYQHAQDAISTVKGTL